MIEATRQGLSKIDRTQIQGKFKVWIAQFMLIPKLLWPLLVYEIGLSTVERVEKMINRFTRKWLGLPPGLTNVALYSRRAKLRLPMKSVVEEYKVGKVRLQAMLELSGDCSIKEAKVQLKTGRKWKTVDALTEAEERVKFQEVAGASQVGRHGLGYGPPRVWWSSATVRQRRDLILQEVHGLEEVGRYQMAVQQGQQGQWTSWEEALQRSLSWSDMWNMAPLRLGFMIRAVYDQLPTSDNLAKWNKTQDKKCGLCGGSQTLKHVLSACKQSLAMGRYTWRHNQVLRVIAEAVDKAVLEANSREGISSEALGQGSRSSSAKLVGLLEEASDWKVAADLEGRRTYAAVFKENAARPDIVALSTSRRTAVLVESTVPFESNMSESHEFKLAKYEVLREALHADGDKVHLFAVEVGTRRFAGASLYSL